MGLKETFAYFYKDFGLKVFVIGFGSFLVTILEGLSFISVIPLIDAVSDGSEGGLDFQMFSELGISVDIPKESTGSIFLIFFVVLFFLKVLGSFALRAWFASIRRNYIVSTKKEFTEKFFNIDQNLYSKYGSGHFLNVLNVQINRAVDCFDCFINFVSLSLGVIGYLFFVVTLNPRLALLAGFMGLLMLIVFQVLNKKIKTASIAAGEAELGSARAAADAFHNFNYLQATSREKKAIKDLDSRYSLLGSLYLRSDLLSLVGGHLREPFALAIVMVVITLELSVMGTSLSSLVVTLLLLYRVMNTLHGIQAAWIQIGQYSGNLGILDKEFKNCSDAQRIDRGMIKTGAIKRIVFEDVSFQYENRLGFALRNFSWQLERGKIYGVAGPSGSGKSTFLKLFLGLLAPNSGVIWIDGLDRRSLDRETFQARLGYIPQDITVFDDTIRANLLRGCIGTQKDFPNDEQMLLLLKSLGLGSLQAADRSILDLKVGEGGKVISGGQKQRLALVRELLSDPEVLVLDEPTSALDNESASIVRNVLVESKSVRITVLVSHDENDLSFCDEIIRL